MKAEGLSPENVYIRKATLNGKELKDLYIDYADIVKGGELVFEMGPKK